MFLKTCHFSLRHVPNDVDIVNSFGYPLKTTWRFCSKYNIKGAGIVHLRELGDFVVSTTLKGAG
jgi:hypothetical protein